MKTSKVTSIALLVAMGAIASSFSIPIGVAKVYPVQHAINVFAGVLFGPGPAVLAAFLTSTIRNMIGTGTPLAFPGSMFGALLAGLAFRCFKKEYFAAIGEVLGTSILGALVAFPLARLLLGFGGAAFFFIVPFAISSASGALIGMLVLRLWWNRGPGRIE